MPDHLSATGGPYAATLRVRMAPDKRQALDRLAESRGMTASAYVRSIVYGLLAKNAADIEAWVERVKA